MAFACGNTACSPLLDKTVVLVGGGRAVGIWLFGILFWTLFLSFSARAGSERDKPKVNKNPYSAKAIFGKAIDPFYPKNAQTVHGHNGANKTSNK